MIKLTRTDKVILKNLPEYGEGIQSYAFFVRFKILPFQLAGAVQRLKKYDLINVDGAKLSLTKNGFKWVLENRHLLRQGKLPLWKQPPEEFLQPKLKANAPYIPIRSKLHKRIKERT